MYFVRPARTSRVPRTTLHLHACNICFGRHHLTSSPRSFLAPSLPLLVLPFVAVVDATPMPRQLEGRDRSAVSTVVMLASQMMTMTSSCSQFLKPLVIQTAFESTKHPSHESRKQGNDDGSNNSRNRLHSLCEQTHSNWTNESDSTSFV